MRRKIMIISALIIFVLFIINSIFPVVHFNTIGSSYERINVSNPEWREVKDQLDRSNITQEYSHISGDCAAGPPYLAYLDNDTAIILCELDSDYVEEHEDLAFIDGGGYCGNRGLSFGAYAVVTLDENDDIEVLEDIESMREFFSPIENKREAVSSVLLGLNNIDYSSIYVKEIRYGYKIILFKDPSACRCGIAFRYQYTYRINNDGNTELLDKEKVKTVYHASCAN